MIDSDVLTDSLWLLLQILRHNIASRNFSSSIFIQAQAHSEVKMTPRSHDAARTFFLNNLFINLFFTLALGCLS